MSSSKIALVKPKIVLESQVDRMYIYVHQGNHWTTYKEKGRAQNVLMFMQTILQELGLSYEDVSDMGVVMEGESFTATRIITVIANTIGFIHDIEICALPKQFSQATDEQKNNIWDNAKSEKFVLPEYSGEPTITLKPLNVKRIS